MAKQKKSTKKFVRKHLKQEIKHRKQTKGIRNRKRDQLTRAAQEKNVKVEGEENEQVRAEDMSIEDFLGGGFVKLGQVQKNDDESSLEDVEMQENDRREDQDEQASKLSGEESENEQDYKQQLDSLKDRDPEFYKFLQQTDKELLEFEDEEEEEEDDEEEDGKKIAKTKSQIVTSELVEFWCKQVENEKSYTSFKNLLKAYRTACRKDNNDNESSLSLASSAVYNQVVVFVLKQAGEYFSHFLGGQFKYAPKQPKWKKVEAQVSSFLVNTLYLLDNLIDGPLIVFCLKHVRPCCPLIQHIGRLGLKYLKLACKIFGQEDNNNARIQAILLIRELALKLPSPMIDRCIKKAYRSYCANCRFVNTGTLEKIRSMQLGLVELFGLDIPISYQYGFEYVKQLAIVLRRAMASKTKDGHREVYCWKYINCLEAWVQIVATHSDKGLEPLVHPVVQLLIGVVRLVPSPKYFPIRFRMVRLINFISEKVGVYVPITSLLIEVLQWADLHKTAQRGQDVLNFLMLIKISKNDLKTMKVQQEVIAQMVELLAIHLSQWSSNIAFPELTHIPVVLLRKFVKTSTVERFRSSIKRLVEAIEKSAIFVSQKRNQVAFSPQNINQVEKFLKEDKIREAIPIIQYTKELIKQKGETHAFKQITQLKLGNGKVEGNDQQEEKQEEKYFKLDRSKDINQDSVQDYVESSDDEEEEDDNQEDDDHQEDDDDEEELGEEEETT